MAISFVNDLNDLIQHVRNNTKGWVNSLICDLEANQSPAANFEAVLLGYIAEVLDQIQSGTGTGTLYRITPFQIQSGGDPVIIVDRDSALRARDIIVWPAAVLGGPVPTLTIGTSQNANIGIPVTPGIANSMGKVTGQTQLWAGVSGLAAGTTYTIYVIESG